MEPIASHLWPLLGHRCASGFEEALKKVLTLLCFSYSGLWITAPPLPFSAGSVGRSRLLRGWRSAARLLHLVLLALLGLAFARPRAPRRPGCALRHEARLWAGSPGRRCRACPGAVQAPLCPFTGFLHAPPPMRRREAASAGGAAGATEWERRRGNPAGCPLCGQGDSPEPLPSLPAGAARRACGMLSRIFRASVPLWDLPPIGGFLVQLLGQLLRQVITWRFSATWWPSRL